MDQQRTQIQEAAEVIFSAIEGLSQEGIYATLEVLSQSKPGAYEDVAEGIRRLSALRAKQNNCSKCPQGPPRCPQGDTDTPLILEIPEPIAKVGCSSAAANISDSAGMVALHSGGIVQFSTAIYFCKEGEANDIALNIMRLGSSTEKCAVKFETMDASAKNGIKYIGQKGELVFEPGEDSKELRIAILEDDDWDATLEFEVRLFDPTNCQVGKYLGHARVKIIDNDCFPTNKYREEIMTNDIETLRKINVFALLLEYFKLNFRNPIVNMKTKKMLVVDQMQNLYFIWRLLLIQNLIDEVVGEGNRCPDDGSFFMKILPCPDTDEERQTLLIILGILVVVPLVVVHYWDYNRVFWKVGGTSRKIIQANLLRKYLNFDELSRQICKETDLIMAMTRDTFEVVHNGYMNIFPMSVSLGRLLLLSGLQIYLGTIMAAIPVFLIPLLLGVFLKFRAAKSMHLSHDADSHYNIKIQHVGEVLRNYRLVADYNKRPLAVEAFEKKIGDFNWKLILADANTVNNRWFAPWLSATMTGIWLLIGGMKVINKDGSSVGFFVTNLEIFAAVGQAWTVVYLIIIQTHNSCPSLLRIVRYMNLPTDTEKRMHNLRQCISGGMQALKIAKMDHPHELLHCDLVPMKLVNICYRYSSLTWRHLGDVGLQKCSISFPQGKFIVIVGKPSQGKSTILKLISGVLLPDSGELLFPSHHRVLYVSQQPLFYHGTLYENLCYGCAKGSSDSCPQRALKIAQLLNVKPSLCDFLNENDEEKFKEQAEWGSILSYTQMLLLNFARALMANPEVLVLHKPLQHFDHQETETVLDVFKEFCRSRGVGLSSADLSYRRPRSVIMSSSSKQSIKVADLVLVVDELSDHKTFSPGTKTYGMRSIMPIAKEEISESMMMA
eukprot:gnl/MRDRNA2_/MRDRNA2_72819_c0_seq1.p1 gnl/MRDRNA2_/MRDRNA2_72819_c0~~gnl/MRDRNA2_/MRDRNA2_72819_c0_seq1.p1  ORF type:complete len:892 (+),score=122.99 gnl/MRDRNA2_/MRDRNA2_72819_c0_seq1:126-2801(+)